MSVCGVTYDPVTHCVPLNCLLSNLVSAVVMTRMYLKQKPQVVSLICVFLFEERSFNHFEVQKGMEQIHMITKKGTISL